jgi:hypothetical protein
VLKNREKNGQGPFISGFKYKTSLKPFYLDRFLFSNAYIAKLFFGRCFISLPEILSLLQQLHSLSPPEVPGFEIYHPPASGTG